ncbi:MAG: tRNA threonylcarbamoyladenosine biosynthesis protein TsaB, partial [Oscillospiraceae bacterium]
MAKGLCLPYNIPAVGVSTLESLATGIDGEGSILCALDARRSEVYYAVFTRNNGVLKRITKDTAAPAASLEQMCCKADKPLYIAGDGAKLCYEAFGERIGAMLVNEHNRYSRAKGVCAVAMKEYAIGHAINADDLKPSYHRLSQAQRERQERENKIDG